jgi:hypothetical protein
MSGFIDVHHGYRWKEIIAPLSAYAIKSQPYRAQQFMTQ